MYSTPVPFIPVVSIAVKNSRNSINGQMQQCHDLINETEARILSCHVGSKRFHTLMKKRVALQSEFHRLVNLEYYPVDEDTEL